MPQPEKADLKSSVYWLKLQFNASVWWRANEAASSGCWEPAESEESSPNNSTKTANLIPNLIHLVFHPARAHIWCHPTSSKFNHTGSSNQTCLFNSITTYPDLVDSSALPFETRRGHIPPEAGKSMVVEDILLRSLQTVESRQMLKPAQSTAAIIFNPCLGYLSIT